MMLRQRALMCIRSRESAQCQGQVYATLFFDGTHNNMDWKEPGTPAKQQDLGKHSNIARLFNAAIAEHDEPRVVRRVLDHGAAGFIPKSANPSEISEAVHAVLNCGTWLPPALARSVAALPSHPADADLAARLARLTEQQYRVLALLGEGLLNKQIADRLGIQERTVKAHATAIFEKLGVRNRTQAGVLLHMLDLGEPGAGSAPMSA